MVVSQNTKQYNKATRAYSYTLYDALGRITEVGEKPENVGNQQMFTSVFGEYVNGQFNPNLINDAKLNVWINANVRREVTHTYYDNTVITGLPMTQDNLRKRVASVTYEDVDDGNVQSFKHGTHYSIDIHGNIKTILQDNKKLYDLGVLNNSTTLQGQRYKRMDYDYDLISGKVNLVRYQDGKPDAFYHFYEYDADNRITNVYTSSYPQAGAIINSRVVEGNPLWEQDCKYFYYGHGPLSRVELGNNKVQGMDYAYNLMGWQIGCNSNTLDKSRDIGQDGLTATVNANVAKDAFGYTLNYYADDYNAIDPTRWSAATDRFEAVTTSSDLIASTNDLFNGNISSMVTTILKPTITAPSTLAHTPLPQGTAYKYDQLNRLKEMEAWQNLNTVTNSWNSGLAYTGMYNNTFSYDANGNILTQLRKDESGTAINNLTYNRYNTLGKILQNRLYSVNDSVENTAFTDDIDDQGTFDNSSLANAEANNNYGYDELGSRKRNNQKEIAQINYSVYGKVKDIIRTAGSTKKNLKFDYDASGNRIAKHVYTSANVWEKSEYYLVDAQGNIMSMYEYKPVGTSLSFAQTEKNIFGSSRVGTDKTFTELVGIPPAGAMYSHVLGNKEYDGANHLGNILATFTDRKLPIDGDNNGTIDEFWPDVVSANDCYPFGVKMAGRSFNSANNRYQFNGKEFDSETETSDFGARNEDGDLGINETIDKLAGKLPGINPYNYAYNNPLTFIDPSGEEGRLSVAKNENGGGTITLETTVHLYGKDASADLAKDLTSASSALGTTKSFKDETGNVWKVNINVTYVYNETLNNAVEGMGVPKNQIVQTHELTDDQRNEAKIQPGDNILKIDNGVNLGSASGISSIGGTGGIVGTNGTMKTIFHETGHQLGFNDRYDQSGTVGNVPPMNDPLFNDDPMKGGHEPAYERQLLHFYDVMKYALDNSVTNQVINQALDKESNISPSGVDESTQAGYKEASQKEVKTVTITPKKD